MTSKKQRTIFTDRSIRALKAKEKPYKLAEWAPRGEGRLMVRVQPTGVKEFFYRYQTNRVVKTLSLGRYAEKRPLKAIRAALREKRRLQLETGDVKSHLQDEARRKEIEKRKGTFRQLLDAYVDHLEAAKKKDASKVRGIFKRNVIKHFPILADMKANEIEPRHISSILARMVKAKITRQVNVTRSYLRAAFAYGGKADYNPETTAKDGVLFGLKTNPVITVPRIARFDRVGNRVLTDDELRAFWLGLEALPKVQASTLRFNLALAGQRPTQLLRADWRAFDWQEGTVLLEDGKGLGEAREHLLPLTPFALEQLKPLRELNDEKKTPSPFTSDGKRGMTIDTLTKAVTEIARKLHTEAEIPLFTQRDLRRTVETMLQRLGVDKEVRAHLLSHGRSKGVQGRHYERYDFLAEKRAALEKWARHLERVLDPEYKATVVPIRAA